MKGDAKSRAAIAELRDTQRDNLNKIVQHGKRADAMVKLHIDLPGHYPLPTALDILPTDEEIAVLNKRKRRNGRIILSAARPCDVGDRAGNISRPAT